MSAPAVPSPVADGRRLIPALSPLNARRWRNFCANRRGLWSLRIFLTLVGLSLSAEFIANDRPLLVWHDGALLAPVLQSVPESRFGGRLTGETDFKDPFIRERI